MRHCPKCYTTSKLNKIHQKETKKNQNIYTKTHISLLVKNRMHFYCYCNDMPTDHTRELRRTGFLIPLLPEPAEFLTIPAGPNPNADLYTTQYLALHQSACIYSNYWPITILATPTPEPSNTLLYPLIPTGSLFLRIATSILILRKG